MTNFAGMTVNERLLAAGLLGQFDEAKAKWDTDALRQIFDRIGLPDYNLKDVR